jgi:hypothetical protein
VREEYELRVLENRVLKKIFGPKRDEVTGDWRKLRKEELHYLYCSPNVISVIKSRRMRWVGHVACMGEESSTGFSGENLKEKDHLENIGVDGRTIMKCSFKK